MPAVTDVYFQTSAATLGYAITRTASTQAVSLFDQRNVLPYIRSLGLWGQAPAATNNQLFVGVSKAQQQDDYVVLDYVKTFLQGQQAQYGNDRDLSAPDYRFFDKSAGSHKDSGTQFDGALPSRRMIYVLPDLLRSRLPNQVHPLFAIIDSNGAHHVSCPLVDYAFNTVKQSTTNGKKRIVFNFDFHEDYGTDVLKPMTCRGWGKFCVSELQSDQAIGGIPQGQNNWARADAYARLCGLPSNRKPTAYCRVGQQIQKVAPSGDTVPIADVVKAILTTLQADLSKVDFYVSVDRDFMFGSFTTYGDGPYSAVDGRQAITDLLTIMKNQPAGHGLTGSAALAGFDIVGLPDRFGRAKDKGTKDHAEIHDQAVADITTLRQAAMAY